MEKTDKELAISIVNTYIGAWFSRLAGPIKPLDGDTLEGLVQAAYNAVSSLPDGGTRKQGS